MSDGALNAPMVRLRAWMFQSGTARRRIVLGIRALTIAAVAVFALTTPGFTSPISINELLNAISFIG